LIDHRQEEASINVETLEIVGEKHRAEITKAKRPMLDAILNILNEQRKFWPLSDRRIHYGLLNDPPLLHASKLRRYENTLRCYKNLVDLLTRGRLAGLVPWEAIADDTRAVFTWKVSRGVGDFVRNEVNDFLKGYWRDLMASQPNHIEIIGEKSTLVGTIKPMLRPHLDAAFEEAPEGRVYLFPDDWRERAMREDSWAGANMRTTFAKIVRRAGVEPWPPIVAFIAGFLRI
jgi:hypothetical protein